MAKCDVCGNDYDKAFQVTRAGRTMNFDSFECAIHAMAPRCAHCDCAIVGEVHDPGGLPGCPERASGGSGYRTRWHRDRP